MSIILENLRGVQGRIEGAARKAGRDPGGVKLICVTKAAEIDQLREIVNAGIIEIGENRVKDALSKKELLDSHVLTWHMIGHLQSKKAKDAVGLFSVIHSVDTLKLAQVLDKEAGKIGKVQDIFIEVNVSGEESKFGIRPKGLDGFLEEAGHLKHIKVLGLMTMPPFSEDPEDSRPFFRKLKELARRHSLNGLSMGMTQDFEVAVEEGATMVRVGSAIFRGVS